jgi:hypothetical protein
VNLRLLFSNQILACEQLGADGVARQAKDTCTDAWAFTLSLPREFWRPGTYELSSWDNQFQEWTAMAVLGTGCGGDTCDASGSGGSGANASGGVLEILEANDQCVTGRVSGLRSSQIEPPVEYNGVFYAVRCESL